MNAIADLVLLGVLVALVILALLVGGVGAVIGGWKGFWVGLGTVLLAVPIRVSNR